MSVIFKEEYPKVGGTPTYVVKCGEINSHKVLTLIIPGNPGYASYYNDYMCGIYEHSGRTLPVWCVSHAGHGQLPLSAGKDENNVRYYGIKDQIWHKLCFIRDHIPADTRLILIGHSIGCYFILRMMKELEPSRVLKAMLLFPTIERLALSEKGRTVTPMLKLFSWMAHMPMYPVHYLTSTSMKDKLLNWYFKDMQISQCAIEATKYISDPQSMKNIASMGNEEMQYVVKADYDVIEKYLHKIMFYYGRKDHWCPIEYYEDMKAKFPKGDVLLCKDGYDHAFILQHSTPMAEISWDWIKINVGVELNVK